jgi:hypothetical protein
LPRFAVAASAGPELTTTNVAANVVTAARVVTLSRRLRARSSIPKPPDLTM